MTDIDTQLDPSPLETEFEGQMRDVLRRITHQERLAHAARPPLKQLYAWPPWSLDTGLSTAQEEFVEAWSPQQVLDLSRSTRQLMVIMQAAVRAHRGDAELVKALHLVATLLPS